MFSNITLLLLIVIKLSNADEKWAWKSNQNADNILPKISERYEVEEPLSNDETQLIYNNVDRQNSQIKQQQNLVNGVLVGPSGPTGILGRTERPYYPGHYRNLANGVLVGPCGPTGQLGRPHYPSIYQNNGGFGINRPNLNIGKYPQAGFNINLGGNPPNFQYASIYGGYNVRNLARNAKQVGEEAE